MTVALERIREAEAILSVLTAFDTAFPRPISARVGSLADHARKLADHAIVVVARRGDAAVGFAAFYANDLKTRSAFLSHLAVDGSCRGQGIGRMLLRWSMDAAKQAGMVTMLLEVDSDNHSAIAFYRLIGFVLAQASSPFSHHMVRERL